MIFLFFQKAIQNEWRRWVFIWLKIFIWNLIDLWLSIENWILTNPSSIWGKKSSLLREKTEKSFTVYFYLPLDWSTTKFSFSLSLIHSIFTFPFTFNLYKSFFILYERQFEGAIEKRVEANERALERMNASHLREQMNLNWIWSIKWKIVEDKPNIEESEKWRKEIIK